MRTEEQVRERIREWKNNKADCKNTAIFELEWVLSPSEKKEEFLGTDHRGKNCRTPCGGCFNDECWHGMECGCDSPYWDEIDPAKKGIDRSKVEEDCCGNYDNGDCLGSLCECECHKEVSSAPKEKCKKKFGEHIYCELPIGHSGGHEKKWNGNLVTKTYEDDFMNAGLNDLKRHLDEDATGSNTSKEKCDCRWHEYMEKVKRNG